MTRPPSSSIYPLLADKYNKTHRPTGTTPLAAGAVSSSSAVAVIALQPQRKTSPKEELLLWSTVARGCGGGERKKIRSIADFTLLGGATDQPRLESGTIRSAEKKRTTARVWYIVKTRRIYSGKMRLQYSTYCVVAYGFVVAVAHVETKVK